MHILRLNRLLPVVFACTALAIDLAPGQEESTALPALSPLQQQVIRQIVDLPVGPFTLETQNLPSEYLARVADRIIRADFQRNRRLVVRDQGLAASPESAPAVPAQTPAPAVKRRGSWIPFIVGGLLLAVIGAVMARRSGGRSR